MPITKAIITSASPTQAASAAAERCRSSRSGPHGARTDLEEIIGAGIEDVAIVICPGTAERYLHAAGEHAGGLSFFEQNDPRGYGDALLRARDFAGPEPFLHLVSDHLYVTKNSRSCAAQLIAIAEREQCAVSAIQPTRENQLAYFGTSVAYPYPGSRACTK